MPLCQCVCVCVCVCVSNLSNLFTGGRSSTVVVLLVVLLVVIYHLALWLVSGDHRLGLMTKKIK